MDALQLRDNAKQQLAEIKTIETGVEYLNKVKAIEIWAKAEKKDAELQNIIAEQKLRTQRILGELIPKHISRGNEKGSNGREIVKSKDTSLQNFGITPDQSSAFQKIAKLPQEIFEQEIATAKRESSKRIELTTSRMLKVAKILQRENDINNQKENIKNIDTSHLLKEYDVVVIDPPWNYNRSYDPNYGRVANPYPSMSLEEIKNIKIPASNNSVLWLWTTHAYLFESKNILENWGFEYKATLVWDKEKIGMGHWLRMQCEFCLLGIKGKPVYNNTKYRDIITEKGREHSRKPEIFYKMVEDTCIGTKLNYFSRENRKGWFSFGNDINKFSNELER